ncbi:MAG: extracellular solute-binding protein [Bacilli bacterium]|nr:extracellular solute-binding protein [Bacilli bacterium]
MNKKLKLIPLALLGVSAMTGCNANDTIYIYTAHEDNRIAQFNKELKEKFPEYNIEIVSKTTGQLMAELESSGTSTDCDIFVGIEITNAEILLKKNADLFADLSDYDTSHYVDEVLEYQKDITLADGSVRKGHKKYHIQDKEAGCIVYSKSLCGDNVPTSYNDLLDAKYQGKIIMPNPKTSGTGYYFYNGLASLNGKDAALNYFNSLNANIKEWSASGSGPVKGVDKKEIAVGLGMHFQAVEYANKNDDIGITYFTEGSPYTLYTMGMINGKEKNAKVKEVYDYFFNYVNYLDNCNIVPETIYKKEFAKAVTVENWKSPSDYGVDYTAMKNLLDPDYKNELLDAWKL